VLQPIHFVEERTTPYLTVTDFFRTLDEEMHKLYLLSFLLTADHDKAEECFVSAMEECVEGAGVFMDWGRSWTRVAVVKHAIQMIQPAPEHVNYVSFASLKKSATLAENNPFAEVLLLDAFERFIFVMSILEERSDEECAVLLSCSPRDVMIARLLALKRQSITDALTEEILQS
jgi:hypothetical protein